MCDIFIFIESVFCVCVYLWILGKYFFVCVDIIIIIHYMWSLLLSLWLLFMSKMFVGYYVKVIYLWVNWIIYRVFKRSINEIWVKFWIRWMDSLKFKLLFNHWQFERVSQIKVCKLYNGIYWKWKFSLKMKISYWLL